MSWVSRPSDAVPGVVDQPDIPTTRLARAHAELQCRVDLLQAVYPLNENDTLKVAVTEVAGGAGWLFMPFIITLDRADELGTARFFFFSVSTDDRESCVYSPSATRQQSYRSESLMYTMGKSCSCGRDWAAMRSWCPGGRMSQVDHPAGSATTCGRSCCAASSATQVVVE